MRPLLTILAVLLVSAPIVSSAADTVTLAPTKDNTLYGALPGDLANGAGQYLFTGVNLNGGLYRALLAFDIAGNIPADATILSVTLSLHMSRTITGGHMHTLHVVAEDWGEGPTDAPGQEGGGAPPLTGDATWLHTFFNTGLWTNPGGDFLAAVSASAVVDQIGFYAWSDAAMASDVQNWLDDPGTNFGWLLMGDEASSPTAKRFDSHENPEAALWPMLTVEYERLVPTEASSWGSIKALYR